MYSERYFSPGGRQLVDHSIASRTHTQYIASQMHDEAVHCKHRFADYGTMKSLLINQRGKIADINYATMEGAESSHMPEGLETQEVYLFSYL